MAEYTLSDAVADLATGGLYTLTKATTSAATTLAREVVEETGQVLGDVFGGGAFAPTGAQPGHCCPRYQLVGDFLLETMTGRVWKYDSQDDEFVAVPKRVSPLLSVLMKHKLEGTKATFDAVAKQLSDAYPKDREKKTKEIANELLAAADHEMEFLTLK